jgi:hypothetical protein
MAAQTANTQYVEAANGVKFAYRTLGSPSDFPLVLHGHFRSNMDYWVGADKQTYTRNLRLLVS